MADEGGLNHESFELLLAWLGPDREQAGRKYETIRKALINIFTWRACGNAEDLADKTINRVAQKLPAIIKEYSGDPARYFYGFAYMIIHEHFREESKHSELPEMGLAGDFNEEAEASPAQECLDHCLQQLSAQDRELILRYHQYEKETKIEDRKQLAQRLGIEMNALRIRASRIRSTLRKCIRECLEQKGQAEP